MMPSPEERKRELQSEIKKFKEESSLKRMTKAKLRKMSRKDIALWIHREGKDSACGIWGHHELLRRNAMIGVYVAIALALIKFGYEAWKDNVTAGRSKSSPTEITPATPTTNLVTTEPSLISIATNLPPVPAAHSATGAVSHTQLAP